MANGSSGKGTRKTGQGFRTPKLSDAQKRSEFGMGKGTKYTGGDVPF